MTQWRPLSLPRLTLQDAAAARARHAPRIELPLGPSLRLRLCPEDERPCGPDPVRIALQWGEHRLAVHCPAELIRDALGALDPDLAGLDALPPDLAGLLLETAAIDLIARWEAASGRAVTVLDAVRDASPPGEGLAMAIGVDGGAVQCRVHLGCTPAQADAVLASWPLQPRRIDDTPLPAVLRLGTTRLSSAVLASLRPGDTVLLEQQASVLVIAGKWVAAVQGAGSQWTLTQPPSAEPDHRQGGWAMAEPNEDAASAASLDELPVTLTFEVGRLTVELGELRRFGPGSVIELANRQPLVEIAAHGRRIGEGELVELDGAVGVKITRLFDHA